MTEHTRTQHNTTDHTEELLPIVRLLKEYGNPREYILTDENDVAYVEKMFDDLIEFYQSDWVFNMWPDILKLLDGELKELETTQPELYARVQRIVAKGQWLTLDRCEPEQIEGLFQNYFEYFFNYTWEEVDRKTRLVLLTIPSFEKRDALKQSWNAAIAQSTAAVSEDTIEVNGQNVEGTVQNWMMDFELFLNERDIDPLLIIEYLGSSENAKRVDEKTRSAIESVLRYTEILQRSSLTPEGAEETFVFGDPISGRYQIFDRGEVRDTEVDIPADELEALRYSYNVDDQGKPQSFAHQVQTSPLFTEGIESRYQAPSEAAQPEVPIEDLTSPPTEVVPMMDREVEAAAAPEEATVVEPVLPDEKLVPPPPLDQQHELPTMRIEEPVPPATPVDTPQLDYSALAHHVLDELKLMLPSLEMEKRFLSVLNSYFRGVRDRMEAQEALRQTEQEGGVNLPPEQISTILSAADEALEQAQSGATPHAPVPMVSETRPVMPTLEAVQERMRAQQQRATQPEQQTEEVQDILSNVNPIFSAASNTPAPQEPATPSRPRTSKAQTGTKTSRGPRMMSPVDELRSMNLTEFRRLASTPQEAAGKLLNMINLLAEESLAKKADGVAAWKASSLHNMYVDIGNRSLESGRPVNAVITEMQSAVGETLTQDEFDAIADMNSSVRF